jgi:hypothetical protein
MKEYRVRGREKIQDVVSGIILDWAIMYYTSRKVNS